jgi:hypothetical protein
MSDKTCLDLMVGLGNKYPKQLLYSAVHKVLFSDSTIHEGNHQSIRSHETPEGNVEGI